MNLRETFRAGIEGVFSHRLRSALTVLGIMIGITAVILTVGLGEGAQQQVGSEITALGSNLLTVSPGSSTSTSGVRGGFGSASTLTTGDAAAGRTIGGNIDLADADNLSLIDLVRLLHSAGIVCVAGIGGAAGGQTGCQADSQKRR